MHQTVKCSSVGSIGDLGHIARAAGAEGFNIEAIGGAESGTLREDGRGVGIISLLVTPDENADIERLADVLRNLELDDGRRLSDVSVHPSLHVELRHGPGELGEAAAALGDSGINIQSILLIDAHDGWAVVSLAFDEGDIENARNLLGDSGGRFRVLPKHGGKSRRDKVDGLVEGNVNHGDDVDDMDDGPGHGH